MARGFYERIKIGSNKKKLLWDKEFDVVKEGLDEEQVSALVDELMGQYSVLLDEHQSATPIRTLHGKMVQEADREAASIRLKAKRDAKVEASELINEATQDAREILTHAREQAAAAAEKEREGILSAVSRKAQLVEDRVRGAEMEAAAHINEARQNAQQLLAEAREQAAEAAAKQREMLVVAREQAAAAAEKQTEEVLSAVFRKAQLVENRVKQQAQLYLLKAREQVEEQVRADIKQAYTRITASLQTVLDEGGYVEAELRNRSEELWKVETFELENADPSLPQLAESLLNTLAHDTATTALSTSGEEITEQSLPLDEEDAAAISLTRIPHLAQTSDAVNRQLSCFSSRCMNLLAVFQI